ncbi:MAG TPA: DUF1330 domain-containing protein [Candidatus Binataceae bacterium]|nr:DUF1330 domain-containing protein [Candidatus Binataceae bacterium]
MKVENAVYPNSARVAALMSDSSPGAIVMLNLLKFRAKAVYTDGRKTDLTGAQAYNLYAEAMRTIVEREGGKFLFAANIKSVVIGEVEEVWDIAALVEYPSSAAFAKIATSPEVGEIGVHRVAGLKGQLLIRVSQR